MILDISHYKQENLLSIVKTDSTRYLIYGAKTINGLTGYPVLKYTEDVEGNYSKQSFILESLRRDGDASINLNVTDVNLKTDAINTYNLITIAFGGVIDITAVGPDMEASSCGITITDVTQDLSSEVVVNAVQYEFQLTDTVTDVQVSVFNTGSERFVSLDQLSGWLYGNTYNISSRVFKDGVWSEFGNKCLVTTLDFIIGKSFLFDGVNESFTIPNSDLNSLITGTAVSYSLSFHIKRDVIGGIEKILANYTSVTDNAINLDFHSGNTLRLRNASGLGTGTLQTSDTFTSTSDWLFFTIVVDGNTPANSAIYCNGINKSIGTNTLLADVNSSTGDFFIGSTPLNNNVNFQGNLSSLSLIDRAITESEHIEYYNSGLPLSPVTKFGSDCKWFFNPDSSGDVAQFSVTDSVNGITATSINMEDSDKSNLTPYVVNTLADIISDYGFLHAWSPENILEVGSTTQMSDYLGVYDVVNTTVAGQPTLNSSDSEFGGKPSLSFDGVDDHLKATVSGFRSGDTTGSFVMVYKDTGGSVNNVTYPINLSGSSANNDFFSFKHWSSTLRLSIKSTGFNNSIRGSENIFLKASVVSGSSDGSNYLFHTNGNLNTKTMLAGSDNGTWLDALDNIDTLSLGSLFLNGSIFGGGLDLAFVGYLPYTDSATMIELQLALQNYYNV